MADTNENGKLSILPMKEEKRPLLKDISHFLTCFLCDGYFFNATTIVECAHTYCRACIVKFLKTEKYCPACDAQGHRTKSNPSLRYDAILQKLVYKIVPGLYQNELKCRNSHLKEAGTSNDEDILNCDDRLDEDYYFSPDEPISISLEYIDNKIDGHQNDVTKSSEKVEDIEKEQVKHKRYLQCPAKLTIRHIYKFIKLKYNLQRNQEVEVLYDKTKLPGSFSLMDVAYTFSWKRDTPMRLCYQILESITIKVPQTVTDKMPAESVPVKNNFVTNSSSPNNIGNAVQSTNQVHFEETTKTENLSTKVNLKRKLEVVEEVTSNTKESTTNDAKESPKDESSSTKSEPELPGHGLLVKVPRISSATFKDIMDFKKEGHEDKPKPTATVSPCTENGLKLPLKSTSTSSADDFNDDYMKYEQDIEEVEDDDDDDDDDRLRISHLSEEDTQDDKPEDNSDQNLVIETSDIETAKEDRKEQKLNGDASKKSAKYKRKSKKSKHSHHHKHRHHERKSKTTPQATIMHSPDTDINVMKLKLKLNNVKPDAKYHKQKRKRKKSSECYYSSSFSSSSSVSSVHGMSPDTHSTSRVDEDSLHSHTSELSAESIDTSSSKDEISNKSAATVEPADKYQSSTSKEKLLQMRAFRPRSIAVVKPEENHKLEKPAEKPSKNDNNNNNDSTVVVESKEKSKPTAPVVLRPPSSITVSKITAAEKQKMEQEKLLMMNGNNDDKPSLEIMLVNGPPSSAKSFVSPAVSSTTDVTAKPKTPPRPTRPPPAAIPIVQYQKMKSNDQPPNIPKSLTITPQIQRSKSTNETLKKAKDALSIREGVKRSVSVSLPGNPFHNDFNGALDLSSSVNKSAKYPDTINVPHTLLNKKICMNGVRQLQNTARQMQNGSRPMQNGVRPMPNGISTYSPVRSLSALTDVHPFHKHPNQNRLPMNASPKHKTSVLSPQTSPKLIPSRPTNTKPNKPNVPKLNEIKIGPSSSGESAPPKPGPNQTVRQIPNPSIMLQRHQATVNNISSANCTDYVPIKFPHPSIMGHRIASNACSFSSMKKTSDKCPPAIPLKGYFDISSVMATK